MRSRSHHTQLVNILFATQHAAMFGNVHGGLADSGSLSGAKAVSNAETEPAEEDNLLSETAFDVLKNISDPSLPGDISPSKSPSFVAYVGNSEGPMGSEESIGSTAGGLNEESLECLIIE